MCAGGGIIKGSLGSMLPYIIKAKEDKLGIVLFDDVFKDSMRSGEIDVRCRYGIVAWFIFLLLLKKYSLAIIPSSTDEERSESIHHRVA